MRISLDFNEAQQVIDALESSHLRDRIQKEFDKAQRSKNIGKPKSQRESNLDYTPQWGDKNRRY